MNGLCLGFDGSCGTTASIWFEIIKRILVMLLFLIKLLFILVKWSYCSSVHDFKVFRNFHKFLDLSAHQIHKVVLRLTMSSSFFRKNFFKDVNSN